MPIDTSVPQSPGWWMQRLADRLWDPRRQARLRELDEYYRGDARARALGGEALTQATVSEQERLAKFENRARAYNVVTRRTRTNLARLIVNARRQRMHLRSISTAVDSDVEGDDQAMQLWRGSSMPLHESLLYRLYDVFGEGYLSVSMRDPTDLDPTDPDAGMARMAVDDPRCMVAIPDPLEPDIARAALKMWCDPEAELDFAYLWLPGQLFVATRPNTSGSCSGFAAADFAFDDALGASWSVPIVPVCRLASEDGMGVYEPHLDLIDRIDHDTFMRDSIALLQAFRQRGIIGNLPKNDPKTGAEIDYDNIFESDPGALWMLPQGAEMWESAQTDLGPVRMMITDDVKMLASVTFTPLYVVSPDAATQSAEGVSSMREGLVYAVEDDQTRAGQVIARAISMAFRFMGALDRAAISGITVAWAPAERYSLAEMASADSLAVSLTWRQKQEIIWHQSPLQIRQAEPERADDALLAPALTAVKGAARAQPARPANPAPTPAPAVA